MITEINLTEEKNVGKKPMKPKAGSSGKNFNTKTQFTKKWKRGLHCSLFDIKSIGREYHENLYANKLDNLYLMGKFLERHKFPKLIHKEIKSLEQPFSN